MLSTSCSRNPAEYAAIDDTYSPIIHRVNQAIRFRAVHPDQPFEAPTGGILMRYAQPSQDLIKKAKSEIDALIEAADVKKGMTIIKFSQKLLRG